MELMVLRGVKQMSILICSYSWAHTCSWWTDS